jgi:hypothetical protein
MGQCHIMGDFEVLWAQMQNKNTILSNNVLLLLSNPLPFQKK